LWKLSTDLLFLPFNAKAETEVQYSDLPYSKPEVLPFYFKHDNKPGIEILSPMITPEDLFPVTYAKDRS
jgi:hypothetical protein